MALKLILSMKDDMSKEMKGPIKALKGLGKAAIAVGKVAVTGLGAATGAALALAASSADVAQVRLAFGNLTESIGETEESMLSQLRPATMGVVSDFQLMKSGAQLISMGLVDSAESAAKMSEMAVTLGAAMGTDATESMESFALMLANQSIPRLDTFGISSGKVRTRINELMDAWRYYWY